LAGDGQPVARSEALAEQSLRLHAFYRGKVQVAAKCPIRGLDDFAIWYTPGVAAPCRAIQADPALAYDHTNKGNCIAIVTDGSRVLGLGDIGPQASLPVMEGKALLFKYLGGVDAVPICLRTRRPDDIVRAVELLEPAFGGINLEDIAQPKCFTVLDSLRASMSIPVWHDDQQGSAACVVAALSSALRLVGKAIGSVRIALIGVGAANVATYRLLKAAGARPGAVVACDSKGVLHRQRDDIAAAQREYPDKWRVCVESNEAQVRGGIAQALRGADVCIAFSSPGPGVIPPEAVRGMAPEAIVFACANPTPEIWPHEAKAAGARIVATGRSDFANQVNNALIFPGLFRGVLDVRARTVSDGMALAAAEALAQLAAERGGSDEQIVPKMDDPEVAVRVAVAVAMQAQLEGLAAVPQPAEAVRRHATELIAAARRSVEALMQAGVIAAPGA
jgi:malate dehydrogenase (oxaloacetate-decarboxylating)